MPMAEQDLSILLLINLLQHYITHIHQLILNIHTLNKSNFKQNHFEISALHLFYGVGTKKRSNYSSIRNKRTPYSANIRNYSAIFTASITNKITAPAEL